MASFDSTVEVGADPAAVFDYLADLSNLPDWDPAVRSVEPIGRAEGEGGVGSSYKVVVGFYGRAVETTYEIVEADRPGSLVLDVSGKVTGRVQVGIAESSTGSTVEYRATAKLKGLARVLDKGLNLAFEGMGENLVAALRKKFAN